MLTRPIPVEVSVDKPELIADVSSVTPSHFAPKLVIEVGNPGATTLVLIDRLAFDPPSVPIIDPYGPFFISIAEELEGFEKMFVLTGAGVTAPMVVPSMFGPVSVPVNTGLFGSELVKGFCVRYLFTLLNPKFAASIGELDGVVR